ncbi:MAG: thiamine phosphate synthase [Sphingobacteriaceae bacterium]|jgi:thiamine-phosphate pyrophosphorylase
MKLIVITGSKTLADEPSMVTKMFEDGLMTLHLRKPRFTTQEMRDYIEAIPDYYHNRIIIHSHHILAAKFNLKGIHFTNTHLSKRWKYFFTRLRLRIKFGKLFKTRSYKRLASIHNKEEHDFDYYLMGTVFNNLTGELYGGFYEEALVSALKNTPKKIVARGGVSDKVIEKSLKYGFYGIAFSSYIWESENPCAQFLKLIRLFNELKIEIE